MTSAVVYAVLSLCAINKDFMDSGLLVGLIFNRMRPDPYQFHQV